MNHLRVTSSESISSDLNGTGPPLTRRSKSTTMAELSRNESLGEMDAQGMRRATSRDSGTRRHRSGSGDHHHLRSLMAKLLKVWDKQKAEDILTLPFDSATRLDESDRTGSLLVAGTIKIIGDSPIASGGYCNVFQGSFSRKGHKEDELVAVKCLKVGVSTEQDRKIFRRGTVAWMRLRHPNVLQFYGTFVHEDYIYMVSPWAHNGPLIPYLKRNPGADRQALILQIAEGLRYLHECDIIHGDVKTDNVLISSSGEALVCDYGLSTNLEQLPGISSVAVSIRIAITMRYSAPELLEDFVVLDVGGSGRSAKSRATDVYALGMVILEVFTLERPWNGLLPDAIFMQVRQGRMPPRPEGEAVARGLTPFLWSLVEMCLDINPANRPSMDQLVDSMVTKALCRPMGSDILILRTELSSSPLPTVSPPSGNFNRIG